MTTENIFLTNIQQQLVSGTNIKTVNNNSLVGSGNVVVGDRLKSEEQETVVTTGGTINNQPTLTTFLRFTNITTPIVLTGFGNPFDGKELTVWNDTDDAQVFKNDSTSSIDINRLLNPEGLDILFPIDSKAKFRYSASVQRWIFLGIYGSTDNFTTQTITSGGNYNDLEITANLVIFTNENAQAILNGIWGRKEFHILNLSTTHEVVINNDSSSVTGNGQPIKLPTASGAMGIQGTARILYANSTYGYFLADVWASKYRPEFDSLTETEVITVDANARASSIKTTEYEVFRDAQSTAMSKADLNTAYPSAVRPFNVVCNQLNLTYKKVDENNNDWVSISNTDVI